MGRGSEGSTTKQPIPTRTELRAPRPKRMWKPRKVEAASWAPAAGALGWPGLLCLLRYEQYLLLPLWLMLMVHILLELYDAITDTDVKTEQPKPSPGAHGLEREIGWKELALHNTDKSCWVAVDGAVYDVTAFVRRHPGGKETILLSAGRDITDLIRSYHPFTTAPWQVLSKYRIGTLTGEHEHLRYRPDNGFYAEACRRVGRYFAETGQHYKDPRPGAWRMAIVYTAIIASYCLVVSAESPVVQYMAAAVSGVLAAVPLMHVMHDATHFAWGPTPAWWSWGGRAIMDMTFGAASYSWFHQHVLGHHLYTNEVDHDPDLPLSTRFDFRRLAPEQLRHHIHSYQHVYGPILYGLLTLKFRIQDITETFYSQMNGSIRVNNLDWREWLRNLSCKAWFLTYRILFPVYYFGMQWPRALGLFLVTEIATSYYLAFNFQVSHISSEAVTKPGKTEDPQKSISSRSWAETQLFTSVDYAHGNKWTTFLTGALNYQIPHHLFPCVSQYHYPAIAPIIMDVAREYEFPYTALPSFTSAFRMHIRHLRSLGSAADDKRE